VPGGSFKGSPRTIPGHPLNIYWGKHVSGGSFKGYYWTADKLQPLDLSVNKSAKDFMKSKFQEWYSIIIEKQLEDGIEEEVDMRLSIMKPLSAKWMIELYHYFVSRPDIIINGFHAAGIIDILHI